jgi:hypothetical protein
VLDRVVIGPGPANIDLNARRLSKSRALSRKRDQRHLPLPRGRHRAVGGNPKHTVGLAAFDEARGIEAPRVVFGKATSEARTHGKAGHPTAGLQHAERIVGRRQRETAEAGGRIQVRNQATQHFDRQRVELRRRPDRNPEAGGTQIGSERVERFCR